MEVQQSSDLKDEMMWMGKMHANDEGAKIIWSFDPVHKTARMKPVIEALRLWESAFHSPVRPVTVLWPNEAQTLAEMKLDLSESYRNLLNDIAKKNLTENKFMITKPAILKSPSRVTRDSAKKLVDFAKRSKASVIVMGTHARRGLDRIEKGSFTEQVISRSSVPVLTVRANMSVREQVALILFPTDFSVASHSAFEHAISIAKAFRAKIKIVHVDTVPIETYSGILMPMLNDAAWQAHRQAVLVKGDAMSAIGRGAGIDCEFDLVFPSSGVGDAIVSEVKRSGADLVMLGIQQGPLAPVLRVLLRDIIAGSSMPVLTIARKKS